MALCALLPVQIGSLVIFEIITVSSVDCFILRCHAATTEQPSGESLVDLISQSADAALGVAAAIFEQTSPKLAAAIVYALGCASPGDLAVIVSVASLCKQLLLFLLAEHSNKADHALEQAHCRAGAGAIFSPCCQPSNACTAWHTVPRCSRVSISAKASCPGVQGLAS